MPRCHTEACVPCVQDNGFMLKHRWRNAWKFNFGNLRSGCVKIPILPARDFGMVTKDTGLRPWCTDVEMLLAV